MQSTQLAGMDLQTLLALIIVLLVFCRFVYKWWLKRKQKSASDSCGCNKNNDSDGCH